MAAGKQQLQKQQTGFAQALHLLDSHVPTICHQGSRGLTDVQKALPLCIVACHGTGGTGMRCNSKQGSMGGLKAFGKGVAVCHTPLEVLDCKQPCISACWCGDSHISRTASTVTYAYAEYW